MSNYSIIDIISCCYDTPWYDTPLPHQRPAPPPTSVLHEIVLLRLSRSLISSIFYVISLLINLRIHHHLPPLAFSKFDSNDTSMIRCCFFRKWYGYGIRYVQYKIKFLFIFSRGTSELASSAIVCASHYSALVIVSERYSASSACTPCIVTLSYIHALHT